MKLQNAHLAVIDRRKVVDYLLDSAHPDNGGKAGFFAAFGLTSENPEGLVAALTEQARSGEVVRQTESEYGIKYVVDGPLPTPTNRVPMVRTVWIINRGEDGPRLVTAFPGEKSRL